MSRQTFPVWVDQPGLTMHNFAIDGSAVGASAGSAGLDGRGKFLCDISKDANVVTIDWQVAFGDIPYVFLQPAAGQSAAFFEIVTNTPQQLVYQTYSAFDGTPLNDVDLYIHVDGYDTTSFVS